jgi:DNA-binding MarR family transcriptional regulator
LISRYDRRGLSGEPKVRQQSFYARPFQCVASCRAAARCLLYMRRRTRSRPTAELSKVQYERLAAFRYHLRQFLYFSERAARNLGLNPRQYQALLAIKGFPNRERITIGELAEQLHIAHHSAVGLVDRSVAQNLIAREPGVEDRRQVFIGLTKHGSEILDQLAGAHRAEIRRLGPRMELLLRSLMQDQNH